MYVLSAAARSASSCVLCPLSDGDSRRDDGFDNDKRFRIRDCRAGVTTTLSQPAIADENREEFTG
jgi:hypothetical protein